MYFLCYFSKFHELFLFENLRINYYLWIICTVFNMGFTSVTSCCCVFTEVCLKYLFLAITFEWMAFSMDWCLQIWPAVLLFLRSLFNNLKRYECLNRNTQWKYLVISSFICCFHLRFKLTDKQKHGSRFCNEHSYFNISISCYIPILLCGIVLTWKRWISKWSSVLYKLV